MLDITRVLKIEKQMFYKFTDPNPISEYSNIRKNKNVKRSLVQNNTMLSIDGRP